MIIAPGVTKLGGRCPRPVSFIDIYPTLIDICKLSPKKELEGKSLLQLLKKPEADWQRPALTTHGRNNHSLRSERWRYIRYSDGTEELYDHEKDEMEWNNLANDPKYADIKKRLAKWLPETNVPDVPRANRKKKRSATKPRRKT
jgi:arylsulfatase A-like enzyme